MRTPTIIAIALISTACGTDRPVLPLRSAILQANYAQEVLKQCSRSTPTGVSGGWAIPPELAAQIEKDLPKLAALMPGRNPQTFYRQYVGIVRSSQHFVYINAFAPDTLEKHDDSWQSVPTSACDGGALFWGVVYNPATRTFSELEFNGSI